MATPQEFSPGLDKYISDISGSKPLTREEEISLGRRIKLGDAAAQKKLVEANLRFVGSIARQYLGMGLPMADLISAGHVGLVEAAERFDWSHKVKFVSYAVWWIRQAILQAILEGSRAVRLPVNKVKEVVKLGKVRRAMAHRLSRPPDLDELAVEIGWSSQRVAKIRSISVWEFSLDTPIGRDGETTFMDLVPDETIGPDEIVESKMLWEEVEESMQYLDERSRKVLVLCFGLGGREPLTLEEIAKPMGLTKERIRQIRDRAIGDLKLIVFRLRNSKTKPWLKTAAAPV